MTLKINNVLCYIMTAMDTIPNDDIVSISVAYFSSANIKDAKTLLFSLVNEELKWRKGDDRMKKEIQDIIDLLRNSEKCDGKLPKFVSDAFDAMPPVSGYGALGDTIQSLLNEVMILKEEINYLKQARRSEVIDNEAIISIKESLVDLKNDVRTLKSSKGGLDPSSSPSAPPLSQESFSLRPNRNQRTPLRLEDDPFLDLGAGTFAQALMKNQQFPEETSQNNGAIPKRSRIVKKDEDGFKMVQNKRKKEYGIIGKKKLEDGIKFRSVKKFYDLFIGQCELSVSCEDIKDYVKSEHSIEINEIEKLVTRNNSVNSFKINLSLTDRDKLLSGDLWPEGIVCRKFYKPINKKLQDASNRANVAESGCELIVKSVDPGWSAVVHVEDKSREGILEGRPSKGVAVLWRNKFSSCIKPVYHNDCVIGIKILSASNEILLLNVYLPFDNKSVESLVQFEIALSVIDTLIGEANNSSIILMGDFNADLNKGRFGKLLKSFVIERNLQFADLGLPLDSFTYLSPGHDTTSWIDHIISSEDMRHKISNLNIEYALCLYDHFPISFTLTIDIGMGAERQVSNDYFIMWNKMSDLDKETYRLKLDKLLKNSMLSDKAVYYCNHYNCVNVEHHEAIQSSYAKIIDVMKVASKEFSIMNKCVKKCIPGWKEHVKEFYDDAQRDFQVWKLNGKPNQGDMLDKMKESRGKFKGALRKCRENEEKIRNEKMSQSYKTKNMMQFWKNVRNTCKTEYVYPTMIDDISNKESIANRFSDIYMDIFNDPQCQMSTESMGVEEDIPWYQAYGDAFSYKWQIRNGVRQGGVLSPSLFNIFVNELINKIDKLKVGCKLGTSYSNIIAYADDIVLLAPSVSALQRLLDEIVVQANKLGLKFNVLKSICIVFKHACK
ncbi:unnamed protein product [Rotaria magnacalcarata]|uniref:Reverse transcriptase domain-containing protein n=1 Tax=Rotaria magnacalcarata TaxID=392030 RepID=A0A816W720_9BILA|nr:unnamed protein product [Rotaria magnacalcarata]